MVTATNWHEKATKHIHKVYLVLLFWCCFCSWTQPVPIAAWLLPLFLLLTQSSIYYRFSGWHTTDSKFCNRWYIWYNVIQVLAIASGYTLTMYDLSFIGTIPLSFIPTAFLMIFTQLFLYLQRWYSKDYLWFVIISFPTMITALFVGYEISIAGQFWNVSTPLYPWSDLVQLASLFGINSISFVQLWFAVSVYLGIWSMAPDWIRIPGEKRKGGGELDNDKDENDDEGELNGITYTSLPVKRQQNAHEDIQATMLTSTDGTFHVHHEDEEHEEPNIHTYGRADANDVGKHVNGNEENDKDHHHHHKIENKKSNRWSHQRSILINNTILYISIMLLILLYGGWRLGVTQNQNFYEKRPKHWPSSKNVLTTSCVTRKNWHDGSMVSYYNTLPDIDILMDHEDYSLDLAHRNAYYLFNISRNISMTWGHNVVTALSFRHPNRVQVYNTYPNGTQERLFVFHKGNPVPMMEHFKRRQDDPPHQKIFMTKTNTEITVSALICYDMQFFDYSRLAAGADLVLNPSFLWGSWPDMFIQMIAYRSIENGYNVFHCAYKGNFAVINNFGQIKYRQITGHGGSDPITTMTSVPPQIWTFYSHVGFIYDYIVFSFGCLYVILGFLPPKWHIEYIQPLICFRIRTWYRHCCTRYFSQ